MNECAVLGSRERHHSACRVAWLCEHLGVAQHECLSPRVPSHLRFQHGRETGAESKHQILRETRQIWSGDISNETTCVWKRDDESCEVFGVARAFEERQNITQRREVRATFTISTPKNVETIRRLVHEDRRRTIKDNAAIVNVSYGTVQTILTCDSNMHRVGTKFVPRLLTPEQKEHRVAICKELHQRALGDPSFMSRVIAGDESWVYVYDPETKQVFAMEEPRIPKTEGEVEPQLDQDHAHRVFQQSRECAP